VAHEQGVSRAAQSAGSNFLAMRLLQLMLTRELYEKFSRVSARAPLTKARAKTGEPPGAGGKKGRVLKLGEHLLLSPGRGGPRRPGNGLLPRWRTPFEAVVGGGISRRRF